MSGVLRLGNTGAGTGRSTLEASASNDQTFILPSAGGTLLTSNTSIPGGTITLDGATINITNGDLNVDSGTLFVDESTNRVGIGTTTPDRKLEVNGLNDTTNFEVSDSAGGAGFTIYNNSTDNEVALGTTSSTTELVFGIGGNEAGRFDENERFLVGINTARTNIFSGSLQTTQPIQFETAVDSRSSGLSLVNNSDSGWETTLAIGNTGGTTVGSTGSVAANSNLGLISFVGGTGSNLRPAAEILGRTDSGTISDSSMPGSLYFATTEDGDATTTIRLILDSNGNLTFSSRNGSSGGVESSATNELIFRGGNATQQANVIKLNAGVSSGGWGGESQMWFKLQDGALADNWGSLFRTKTYQLNRWNAHIRMDSSLIVQNYRQSYNRTLEGATQQGLYRRNNSETNVVYAEAGINQRNSDSGWGLALDIDYRSGTGVSLYYFYRLYCNGQIGSMQTHNFYDISIHMRTVGTSSNAIDIDILNYNTAGGGGSTLSFYRQTIANDVTTIWARFTQTYQAFSLINMSAYGNFDDIRVIDSSNVPDWATLTDLSTSVRTISTT